MSQNGKRSEAMCPQKGFSFLFLRESIVFAFAYWVGFQDDTGRSRFEE